MQFPFEITVAGPNGRSRKFTALEVTLIDSDMRRIASAKIGPFLRPLTLWEGAAYDAAGDYTQAQVEARILELLGDNPAGVLESLSRR